MEEVLLAELGICFAFCGEHQQKPACSRLHVAQELAEFAMFLYSMLVTKATIERIFTFCRIHRKTKSSKLPCL
jgi:hypothetical protein